METLRFYTLKSNIKLNGVIMNPYSKTTLRKVYNRNFKDDQIVYIARLGVRLPVYSDLERPETIITWINDGDLIISEEAHYSILKILERELQKNVS